MRIGFLAVVAALALGGTAQAQYKLVPKYPNCPECQQAENSFVLAPAGQSAAPQAVCTSQAACGQFSAPQAVGFQAACGQSAGFQASPGHQARGLFQNFRERRQERVAARRGCK